MPYVLKRDVPSLGLKTGEQLKHEQGKLPTALTFDVVWLEPKKEPKKEPEKQKVKQSKKA